MTKQRKAATYSKAELSAAAQEIVRRGRTQGFRADPDGTLIIEIDTLTAHLLDGLWDRHEEDVSLGILAAQQCGIPATEDEIEDALYKLTDVDERPLWKPVPVRMSVEVFLGVFDVVRALVGIQPSHTDEEYDAVVKHATEVIAELTQRLEAVGGPGASNYFARWFERASMTSGNLREAARSDRHMDRYCRSVTTYHRHRSKVPRNGPCPCGSGKKTKKCCGRPA